MLKINYFLNKNIKMVDLLFNDIFILFNQIFFFIIIFLKVLSFYFIIYIFKNGSGQEYYIPHWTVIIIIPLTTIQLKNK